VASETFRQVYEELLTGHLEAGDTLVDIGSKDGIIASDLAETFGCDSISVDLAFQRENEAASTEFVRTDARSLPFESESVDAVVSNMVLEHVPDEEAIVREVSRVLKSGGIFVVIFPNRLWPLDGHKYPPGFIWLPRRIGRTLASKLDLNPEYYEAAMHPVSALTVKRELQQWFGDVRYESARLLNVEYDGSARGRALKAIDRPLSAAFETPVVRTVLGAVFPVPIYVSRK
jgi:ubiquinone/menaquinone biosynthesis C-methylase UbiE